MSGEGVAGVSYQWQFNSVNITGATSATQPTQRERLGIQHFRQSRHPPGGDSGSPNMLRLTNEVVFLSGRSTTGVSSLMLSNINAMTLSAGISTNDYQPQFVDLSGWPNL
jgi:hypothetical protein